MENLAGRRPSLFTGSMVPPPSQGAIPYWSLATILNSTSGDSSAAKTNRMRMSFIGSSTTPVSGVLKFGVIPPGVKFTQFPK